MKHLLKRLFGTLSEPNPCDVAPTVRGESPLKEVFRRARAQRNIELILSVFQRTPLFVIAGSEGSPDDLNDLFLVPSPGGNGRMCITVSEQREWLSKVKWPKRSTTGERLLSALPPGLEITVVYADGGDFITREHREWYGQLASGTKSV